MRATLTHRRSGRIAAQCLDTGWRVDAALVLPTGGGREHREWDQDAAACAFSGDAVFHFGHCCCEFDYRGVDSWVHTLHQPGWIAVLVSLRPLI